MKKLIMAALTLSIITSTAFANELSHTRINPKAIKVAKKLKKITGQKLSQVEIKFIQGFTVGDGSDCDPLVPDCSGCGYFEQYMCEAMADVL